MQNNPFLFHLLKKMEKSNIPRTLVELNGYLQWHLPSFTELRSVHLVNPDAKQLLDQYQALLVESLDVYSNISNYQERQVTNLMVICARGYRPLLDYKKNALTKHIIQMRDIIGKSAYNYLQANRIGEEMKTILDNVMSISDLYAINNPKTNPRYGMTSNIVVKYLDQKARILKLNMTENVVQQAHFITLRDSGDQRTLMQNIREQYYPVAIYNQFIRELYDTNQGEKLSDNDLEIIRFVLDNEFITDHEVIAYAGYLVHISEKDNK